MSASTRARPCGEKYDLLLVRVMSALNPGTPLLSPRTSVLETQNFGSIRVARIRAVYMEYIWAALTCRGLAAPLPRKAVAPAAARRARVRYSSRNQRAKR